MASETEGSEVQLPSDVESDPVSPDVGSDAGSVQLPSDVESEAIEVVAAHCTCRLRCHLKFDEATVEHQRNEFLKDTANRHQRVYGVVKKFVDELPAQTSRIPWSINGTVVCRPWFEHFHAVGHKAMDDMIKQAKAGHTSLPEKSCSRLPKAKSKMDLVDLWFLALYQGLAEPTPMEDGGHRIENLPDRGAEHEVIEDLNHPLLAATVGISLDQKLVPKRVLNQQDLASLWHAYDLEVADEKASRDTFSKAFNRHWKKILVFKGEGQGVRCNVCADFDQSRVNCSTKKERLEIDLQKQKHLDRADADRSVNVRGNHLSKQPSTYDPKNQETSVFKILIDGMDQAKFRTPRNLKASAAFNQCSRPALHMCGVVCMGVCECFFILSPATKKDSNMQATCLALALDRARDAVEQMGAGYTLPRHLILSADNCPREMKNQYMATWGAWLLSQGYFDSIQFEYMMTGHTKNELDQRFSAIASVLHRAHTLEEPAQFQQYLLQRLKPIHGKNLHVEVLESTWDFQSWFNDFGLQLKGLASTHLQPDTNHVWRMVLRQNAPTTHPVENNNRDWDNLPEHGNDVILILKQYMSSAAPSQAFQLLLPAHLHGSLDASKLTTAALKVWSEDTIDDLRKTARLVAAEPWRLFVAQAWLERMCDENIARKPQDAPALKFVFETSELRDLQVISHFDDLFIPDDPEPREVLVQKGKKRKEPSEAMRRPAAAAAAPALRRPAACMRRPAAWQPPEADQPDVEPAAAEEPAAPAGEEPKVSNGCTKCRWQKSGCARCRPWADGNLKGYYRDAENNVCVRK